SALNAREIGKGQNPLGITHVLNVCDFPVLSPGLHGLAVEWVPIADDGTDDVFGPLQGEADYELALRSNPGARPVGAWWRCLAFLEDALSSQVGEGSRVLVHCAIGVNRSVTIVAAWLMHSWRWQAHRALQYVECRRPIANPVDSHRQQLVAFQQQLHIRNRRCTMM
ncbi:unnamed protein product, partial [Polarella glacialis]